MRIRLSNGAERSGVLPGAQRVRRLRWSNRRSGGFLPCFLLSFALLLGHKLFAQLAVGGEGAAIDYAERLFLIFLSHG